ncbi:MAG: hypothetical protein P1V97_24060 [Planctomycetota bacterium]|nr:hypothetical protein [Planctomycetota bacterium]
MSSKRKSAFEARGFQFNPRFIKALISFNRLAIPMKTLSPLILLCALLAWPLPGLAQDLQSITMKRRPVQMGQSWTVDQATHFEVKNHISQNGRIVELVEMKEKEGYSYKATAHKVQGGQIQRLWIEFGDVFYEKTVNKTPDIRVSPLKKNRYMLQSFANRFYVTDRVHKPATTEEVQAVRVIGYDELGTNRHPFLPPLPKKPIKIGQSIPAGVNYLQGLLGNTYRLKRSKLVLTGTKQFDKVRCAVFQLSFVATVYFNSGVILEITGQGEILAEIETSLPRSIDWSGSVKLSGGDADPDGTKRTFRGIGKTSRKTIVSYPTPKKITPITMGHVVPEIGQRWDSMSKIESSSARSERDANGQETVKEIEFNESKGYSLKVLDRSKSAVTKAEVVFHKFEKSYNSEAPDPLFKGLAQKLLTIERRDPKQAALSITNDAGFKMNAAIRKDISRAVHSSFRPDRTDILSLLPKGPIKAFTAIKLDPKKTLKRLGDDFKGANEIIIEMVLIDTQVIDERECAIFLISINVTSEAKKGSTSTFSESGEMIVEVKTGWPISIRDSGFIHRQDTVNTENGPLKVTTFGPWKSTLLLRYGPRPKKGS